MTSNYKGQGRTGYEAFVDEGVEDNQGRTHGLGLQDGVPGFSEWEAQTCWMISYLVFSVIGLVTVIFVSLYMIPSMSLAIIAASFHLCQGCAACYGEDRKKGARIIQILTIVAGVWNTAVAVISFAAAVVLGNAVEENDHYLAVSNDTLMWLAVVAGLTGVLHAAMSLVTTMKFTRVVKSFDPVSSGQVAI